MHFSSRFLHFRMNIQPFVMKALQKAISLL
ncbi:hypothetical protein BAMY6639_04795 [Bacillus amyloliquefaciens UMAF6639]|nr:hypothetical protein BAMY6639_04795 [Bacillus amyloliquefaciens UMAF6639]